jgi:hypothetical protein
MGTRWVPATHGGYGYGVILYPWWVVGMGMGQFFLVGMGMASCAHWVPYPLPSLVLADTASSTYTHYTLAKTP